MLAALFRPTLRPIAPTLALTALTLTACDGSRAADRKPAASEREEAARTLVAETPSAEALRVTTMDREFPLHGLVTGVQLRVRAEPSPEAPVLGWLRIGSRIRAAEEPIKTSTCATGWHRIAPDGFACAGRGITLDRTPPRAVIPAAPPDRSAGLPYTYYFVKETKVPEYHRLPSRQEQQQAQTFLSEYFALKEKSEERAARFYRGELPNQTTRPAVVRRFLDRGFFVAGAGEDDLKGRRFVLTVRGAYVQRSQLEPRSGSDFEGVVIDAQHPLPVAWAVRTAQPFHIKPRDDGSLRLVADETVPPYERHALVPWAKRERIDETLFHRLADGRYLKYWFLAVAEQIARPRGVGADEPWVHINLEQQTLVLYRGDEPVFATLVSSGLPGHDTPTGLFEIRVKTVSDNMSDIGPDVGEDDRYSIEDVPYTQYFSGSIALHGAFWHDRFGLRRSHGCVNLAPKDAHRVFEHTWPPVTDGWHGLSVDHTGQVASKIWISEK